MLFRKSTLEEYESQLLSPTIYGSATFARLNASKADGLDVWVLADDKDKLHLGAIVGLRDGHGLIPFSAPWGEIAVNKSQRVTIDQATTFIQSLVEQYREQGLSITFSPTFYAPTTLPLLQGVAINSAQQVIADFNYHFNLKNIDRWANIIPGQARNKLNQALRVGFTFSLCNLERAYSVIATNRTEQGYPLAMSPEALRATAQATGLQIDTFVLTTPQGDDAAAALIYRISPGIAEVIYWGDVEAHRHLRPMNLLCREVFAHYASLGFDLVDVGPASTNGKPNFGLCHFKENIGLQTTIKYTCRYFLSQK
jgi:hypothetical protein